MTLSARWTYLGALAALANCTTVERTIVAGPPPHVPGVEQPGELSLPPAPGLDSGWVPTVRPVPVAPLEPIVESEVLVPDSSAGPVPSGHVAGECRCRKCSSYWNRTLKPRLQYKYWGYPEYFCEPPVGYSLNAAMSMQKAEGQRQSLFLYQYDFAGLQTGHPEQLNVAGEVRLRKLVERCLTSGLPLTVEWSAQDPELSEQRRQFVVKYCADQGLGLDDRWVRTGPNEHLLRAPEATLIYENLLKQTSSGGSSGGAQGVGANSSPGSSSGSQGGAGR